jgi:hypothetical protein
MKREGIPDGDGNLGAAMAEFERRYFPAPQDYVFTFGKHIGKTFPEVPASYMSRVKSRRFTDIHPGLAAAVEFWRTRRRLLRQGRKDLLKRRRRKGNGDVPKRRRAHYG